MASVGHMASLSDLTLKWEGRCFDLFCVILCHISYALPVALVFLDAIPQSWSKVEVAMCTQRHFDRGILPSKGLVVASQDHQWHEHV